MREATGIFSVGNFGIYSDTDGADVFPMTLSPTSKETLWILITARHLQLGTSEATVGKEPEADAGGPGTSGNKIAKIIDTDAGDTGELGTSSRMQMLLAAGRTGSHQAFGR